MKLRLITRTKSVGVGVSLDNWDTPKVLRRWYVEVTFWRSDMGFEYIKRPVSGGSCAGLHIGYLHICWGGLACAQLELSTPPGST